MEEKRLRSAKTYFEHEVDMNTFKRTTWEKIDKTERKQQRSRKYANPKWMIGISASILILMVSFGWNGSSIADAAESLYNPILV